MYPADQAEHTRTSQSKLRKTNFKEELTVSLFEWHRCRGRERESVNKFTAKICFWKLGLWNKQKEASKDRVRHMRDPILACQNADLW